MSKRPVQSFFSNPEAKKQKLDSNYSNSNTKYEPVASTSKDDGFTNNQDIWGDDEDDVILLIASQACEASEISEEAINKQTISFTQKNNYNPKNNVSLAFECDFFDDPFNNTNTKNLPHQFSNSTQKTNDVEFNRISMLPNLNSKCSTQQEANFKNPNIALNKNGLNNEEKNYGARLEHVLAQVKTYRLENEKLKTQIGFLTDKSLTKDGEVSILRTQLKNTQSQMDMVRMEKIKFQEKKDSECNNKLLAVQNELQSFKTQIEFKNLEITKMKERCHQLETSKIKLVQPNINNIQDVRWPNFSQKINNSKMDTSVKTSTSDQHVSMDFNSRNITPLFPAKLKNFPLLENISQLFFKQNNTMETPLSFDSEKESYFAERSSFSFIKKRILNEVKDKKSMNELTTIESNIKLSTIHEELSFLMKLSQDDLISNESACKSILKIVVVAKEFLIKTLRHIQGLTSKVTPKVLKQMNDMYLESKIQNTIMSEKDLFDGSYWFENEQAIETRRIIAVVAQISRVCPSVAEYVIGQKKLENLGLQDEKNTLAQFPLCLQYSKSESTREGLLRLMREISKGIGDTGCSHLFSGMLSSFCLLIKYCIATCTIQSKNQLRLYEIIKELLYLRPNGRVLIKLCAVVNEMSGNISFLELLCKNNADGDVRTDYGQGVDTFNNSTCFLQVYCCQIEAFVAECSQVSHIRPVFTLLNSVLNLVYSSRHQKIPWTHNCLQENSCQCFMRSFQCITVCLNKGTLLYKQFIDVFIDEQLRSFCNSTIRSSILLLKFYIFKDFDLILSCINDYEGHFQTFLHNCKLICEAIQLEEIHEEALEELSKSILMQNGESSNETDLHMKVWQQTFSNFSID